MKYFLCLLVIFSLVSCTPYIRIEGNILEAKGCQAITIRGDNKTFVCKSPWELGFIDTIVKALAELLGGELLSTKELKADKKVNKISTENYGFPYNLKF